MLPRFRLFIASGILLAMSATTTVAADASPIRYQVRIANPSSHYLAVEAEVPTGGAAEVELFMPVWTPGSYLVREFARNVEDVTADAGPGKPLAVAKSRKNRWKISTGGAATVHVRYRVYCRELSVRTSWLDEDFTLINGSSVFLTLVGAGMNRPHEVRLEIPSRWKTSISGLDPIPGQPHAYAAPDFDTLVDSPILAGNPAVYEFKVDGKPHYLVNIGEDGIWDGAASAKDVEAIVKEQLKFWGSLPYTRYVFMNLLTESRGGLEHKNSTVLMASRWAQRHRKKYVSWLNLVSHEFFHVWNVKRLRPVELGPFDYENENHTRSLWVAEGFTEYYGRLLTRRAGLMSVEEYLAGDPLSSNPDKPLGDIEDLQSTPGRLAQPLENSSYDAWIKYYRPDENSANSGVSYYTKGAVVGFLLDAEIRKATGGKKSLDDVMRLAYSRFAGDKGYSSAEFKAVAQEVAGKELTGFFKHALETTEELDYADALATFGLRFPPPKPETSTKAWIGVGTKNEGGALVVSSVRRGSPGADAGLNVGDEIVAIDDHRVRADQLNSRLEHYRPEEKVTLLIARRERLTKLPLTFGREPSTSWKLEVDPDASTSALAERSKWLSVPVQK